MNIANELYGSGLLSRNHSQQALSYDISHGRRSRWTGKQEHPFMEAFQRTEPSPKVNQQGWHTLIDALR